MNSVSNNRIDKLVQSLTVLVVDDNQYMRKVVRNILVNLGVKNIHEAGDGIAGLEAIRMFAPDLVILDLGLLQRLRRSAQHRDRADHLHSPAMGQWHSWRDLRGGSLG